MQLNRSQIVLAEKSLKANEIRKFNQNNKLGLRNKVVKTVQSFYLIHLLSLSHTLLIT